MYVHKLGEIGGGPEQARKLRKKSILRFKIGRTYTETTTEGREVNKGSRGRSAHNRHAPRRKDDSTVLRVRHTRRGTCRFGVDDGCRVRGGCFISCRTSSEMVVKKKYNNERVVCGPHGGGIRGLRTGDMTAKANALEGRHTFLCVGMLKGTSTREKNNFLNRSRPWDRI